MKEKKRDLMDCNFSKTKQNTQIQPRNSPNLSDFNKTDVLYRYHSSFTSTPESKVYQDRIKNGTFDHKTNFQDGYDLLDISIENKKDDLSKAIQMKTSQSFKNTEKMLNLNLDGITQSQTEIRHHEPSGLYTTITEGQLNAWLVVSPEYKVEPKKKITFERTPGNMSLNNSHLNEYIKNHPMKINLQENFEKTFKILDKNSLNHTNNFMKQKMSLIKNIETKMNKPEVAINKNLVPPNQSNPKNVKIDKFRRASTKQKMNHSTSENKNAVQQFGIFLKTEEPVFKKKVNRKLSGFEEIKKKPKNEYEFNHMFKILDFLDKDKSLKESRKKIQEKMKGLGRESFNETSKINYQLDQINEENFNMEYKIKGVLGKGSYGEVKLAVCEKTGQFYAVKIYPKKFLKDKIKKQNIQNEKDILLQIDHENIIKLFKVVEGLNSIFLLTEYAGKYSLHETLTNTHKTSLSEDEVRPISWQLVQSIVYLHNENIIHRDIKLHNILVNETGKLKLIDFGFALKLKAQELIRVFCGTPSYMSPEIVDRTPYDGKASDVWALGVCLYRMVVGTFPFRGFLISIN